LALSEFQKLAANDAMSGDNFGYSVGISGNTAVIGAWHDDRPDFAGEDSGSAYIFRDNGAGNWMQLDKLNAAGIARGDAFGSAVAIDGNTAVIGAMFKNTTGRAFIFKDNGAGDWLQFDAFAGDDTMPGDDFGYSVDVSGNTAIIGAWQNNASRGAAYIFRDAGAAGWVQIGKLTADDAMPNDRFGVSVAIEGTTALVGAHFDTHDGGPLAGAVYVFQDNGTSWTQVDKLIASDAHLGNQFGASIALNDGTAVIGSPHDSSSGIVDAGSAYVFRRDESMEWQEVQKLLPDDPGKDSLFGSSVGLSDDAAVVGAYQNEVAGSRPGSAYFFKENALGSWNQVARLLGSDAMIDDALGFSVAASGGIGLVGAPLSNTVATDAGAAYLFNVPAGVTGDYNRNGEVDAADFVVWSDMSGQSGAGLAADGNGDGSVDETDYALWRTNFGLAAPASPAALQAAAVPEPATASLLFLAAGCIGIATSRR
jgi:hypothetical protein